ncbi:MAG: AAA family ATPase [Magnetococcales bacterium]|nr:AAA family ATPase [Magnetococcales bacterium]
MSAAQKLATASPNPKPESWEDVAKLVTMAQESEAYLKFLGLKHNPFPVAPDADVFFLPARIDSLITEVLHCIYTRKGFLVITGEVGLGKTTVSRRILRTLDETRVETALIFNTFIQGGDLLEEINRDFGIEEMGQSSQANMAALNRFLIERYAAGVNCAIVIDDAQNLTEESLEMVRMISNLEVHAEKLVQILLVGQPELESKLDAHALRQLKSRIVVHARMHPYNLEELKQYIAFKLNAAGSKGGLTIPESSYRLLQALTLGNPRRVNILMDRCLYGLFAYNTMRLSRRVVLEVAKELGMQQPGTNWGVWMKRLVLPVAGALGMAAVLLAGKGYWPPPVEESNQERAEARVAREAAVAELARARSERERVSAELAQARAAREAAEAELSRSRAESERAKEAVARAQVAEARALTQVANAKELSQIESEARKKALAEAREAREAAEAAAARAEATLGTAKSRTEDQAKALAEALEARRKAEAQAAEVNEKLARLQAEAEAQVKALADATQVREAAEESARSAREEADKARQEVQSRAARSEEEKKALVAAQSAREQAEQEALKARKESEEAFQRIERARQEAEKTMARGKAEAEAKLALAEAAQRKAEEEAARLREEAARALARVQGEQEQAEKALGKRKSDAERELSEALAARSKAEAEAGQAREEAARAVKAIEAAKNLDQAGKEQALAQARAAHAKAVEEREAEATRVGQVVAKAQEEAGKQAQAMASLKSAHKQAEDAALQARRDADQAVAEASLTRERAQQDVELARADADKAKQELLIARKQMEEMRRQGDGAKSVLPVADEVKRFLAAYGLEAYEQAMAQGMAEGWLDGVGRRIEEEMGLHLVVLSKLPPEMDGKYAVLEFGDKRLLFWKPPLSLKTFFYGHSGQEVKTLQNHLSRFGLHPYPVDGIVGRYTMSALTRYQKQRDLPLTGQPDDATLFWMLHDQGVARESSRPVAGSQKGEAVHWVVQVASLRSAREAEQFRQRMLGKGFECLVVPMSRPDGHVWYTVRSAPVADRAQADMVLQYLLQNFGLKGMVVQTAAAVAPQ